MSVTSERVKKILNDCCGGHACRTTDILHEEFIIIDRRELPSTVLDGARDAVQVAGVDHSVWPLTTATGKRARQDALDYLAASEAIERWTSKQEVIKRQTMRRREELRFKIIGGPTDCTTPALETAIDMIIELEKKAS